jgi:DNA-binding NtrC family response regulator
MFLHRASWKEARVQHGQLVADRFLVTGDRRAIDLASGAQVVLRVSVGGGAAEQTRWSARCEVLHRVRHPRIAALVDYGGLAESHRFEAWRSDGQSRGSAEEGARALQAASRFLRACSLTDGPMSAADVYCLGARAIVIPTAATGYAGGHTQDSSATPFAAASLAEYGICTVDRRADSVLADLFAAISGCRPHIVSLFGPAGAGCTTAGLRAARVARVNGFIPVAVPALARVAPSLLAGRHLCLISDEDGGARWSGLLSTALASPCAHVVLRIGRGEASGVDALHSIRLERVPAAALVAALRPSAGEGPASHHAERAAEAALGLPGRFADLVWDRRRARPARRPTARGHMHSRIAEQSPVYGAHTVSSPTAAQDHEGDLSWDAVGAQPKPGGVTAVQRQCAAAVLLRSGRHAPAVRLLRQTVGALARRREWPRASEAVLMLASALLGRGDPRGALAAIDDTKPCGDGAGPETALIDAALISGHAWIDLAGLDEAESVIGAAAAVARRRGDSPRMSSTSLALSRCLFWKGRYADALSLVNPGPGASEAADFAAARLIAAARAAVGLRDYPRAVSFAREATEQSSLTKGAAFIARAACASAFVHLATGDLDAVGRDVHTCIAAARSAHDPMCATRARLLLAESERRRGRPASSFAARIRRLSARQLPPLLGAKIALLDALLQAPGSYADVAARHAKRAGLPALSLFGPGRAGPSSDSGPWPESSTDDLVGILHLCQAAEDEPRVLAEVCARVRQHLHAAAVAIIAPDSAGSVVIAADGGRMDPAVALRAIAMALPVAPHRFDERLDAAVPVRYGGAPIGALAARWPLGTPYDLSRAPAVLTMAATAAAPIVSAALIRRSRPHAPALADLLGVTPQMAELRRAIDRAAAAPFAVLIEGESGSGKELVAKAIHRSGLRRDRAFCTLNCAALPDDLVEAELFGHARGAFTGAVHERAGVFEEAHGGTLMLDEVGELSPRAQAKLLRVIQEGELRRIGENLARRVDVRIVAATNRDLRHEVSDGRFRLDLLYRLDVVRLTVPPLRDRREDVGMLAEHFWREATGRVGSRAVLAAATLAALAQYDWPGNVRELQNVLAALAVRTPRRGVVMASALPPHFGASPIADASRLEEARRIFEERFVRAALVRCGGHRTRAAAELGVTRQGLTKLLTRLGIEERRRAVDPTTARAR